MPFLSHHRWPFSRPPLTALFSYDAVTAVDPDLRSMKLYADTFPEYARRVYFPLTPRSVCSTSTEEFALEFDRLQHLMAFLDEIM